MATNGGEEERGPRSPQAVARRVLALFAIVCKAKNQFESRLNQWVIKHKIADCFSPAEAAFFSKANPSEQEVVNCSWRAEALVPLLWALGILDELPQLNVPIGPELFGRLKSLIQNPNAFIVGAALRPNGVLEGAEQDLYHQHWRVRDAELFGKAMPEGLDPGIVYERRYGASWLVGWGDDWDNVPTDT